MTRNTFRPTLDVKMATAIAKDTESTPEQLDSAVGVNEAVDRLLAKHSKAGERLLEKLSHSSDKTTRKNVVLNANAAKNVLIHLAPQFPTDFFKNPAFDWLLLEDPNLLFEIGGGVLKNILKRPECPQSFMTWAVNHGSEQEQLAVVMNPVAPVELIETLARNEGLVGEAAKLHSKVGGTTIPNVQDGRTLVEAEIRLGLADLASHEARGYWKRGFLGPAKWAALSLSARLRVLGLKEGDMEDGVPYYLQHYKAKVRPMTPDVVLGCSNKTAAADLARLAEAKSVNTVVAVAQNPRTPAMVLTALGHDKRGVVRKSIAANQATPIAMLELLTKDKNTEIRIQAISNPLLPLALVKPFLRGKNVDIKRAARIAMDAKIRIARSIQSSPEALTQLVASKKSKILQAVALNPVAPESTRHAAFELLIAKGATGVINKLMAIIDEPLCPAEIRAKALTHLRARRWWRDLNTLVKKNANGSSTNRLPTDPDSDVLVKMLSDETNAMLLAPEQTLLAKALAFESGDIMEIPPAEADAACKTKSRAVRLMGLMHAKASPDVLAKRSKSTDWAERLAIACNTACPPNILNMLEKDTNAAVARQVGKTRQLKVAEAKRQEALITTYAQAPNLTDLAVEVCQRLRRGAMEWELAGTPWWRQLKLKDRLGAGTFAQPITPPVPPEILTLLADHPEFEVRRFVARNPSTPLPVLEKMLERNPDAWGHRDLRHSVIMNPSLPPKLKLAVAHTLDKDYLHRGDGLVYFPEEFCEMSINPETPLEMLNILLSGHSHKQKLAQNPSLPADVLRELAKSYPEAVAVNPSAPKDLLDLWLKDPDFRCVLAINPAIPAEIRDELAKELCPEEVATNPYASITTLELMALDKSSWIRRTVAKNPSLPLSLLELLATDAESLVRASVAENPSAPWWLLHRLASDKASYVRDHGKTEAVSNRYTYSCFLEARSDETPVARLIELGSSGYWSVRFEAINNPAFPVSHREAAVKAVTMEIEEALHLPEITISPDQLKPEDFIPALRSLDIMPNPSDSKSIAKAAKSKDWLERVAVALNPRTPQGLLRTLLDDSVEIVKQLVSKRLKEMN